jgi:hypothetical protein
MLVWIPPRPFTPCSLIPILTHTHTQMFLDGSPAEFTPIGEWVREHSVFNAMKARPFFRNFMGLRMFRTWRAAARKQSFDKARSEGRGGRALGACWGAYHAITMRETTGSNQTQHGKQQQ